MVPRCARRDDGSILTPACTKGIQSGLVVNQGSTNAQYQGQGTINGAGAYKFMLWARDLDPGDDDTFRIKIWYEDGGEIVVYDNGFDQAIGGGNIKVHQAE
jgi:hypothetical protein